MKMGKSGIKVAAALMATAITLTGVDGALQTANVAYAAESFTVTEKKAVLYSNGKASVYATPDLNAKVLTTIAKDLPVEVTGITSNGWFRINLNGTYYVPGYGLESKEVTNSNVVYSDNIKELTKGTFSFYKNSELSEFDDDDIEDMDENTYIKYLDSFLMGYAMVDYCILQDSGKTLKTVYDNAAKTDSKVAGMSMQTYLLNYRNQYLSDSLIGPFRNEKDLKVALNRAIRYDIQTFGAVYRNATIDDSEDKMKKLMEDVIKQMKAEQGVSFTCRMEYGTYTIDDKESKGWIIEFTRKK